MITAQVSYNLRITPPASHCQFLFLASPVRRHHSTRHCRKCVSPTFFYHFRALIFVVIRIPTYERRYRRAREHFQEAAICILLVSMGMGASQFTLVCLIFTHLPVSESSLAVCPFHFHSFPFLPSLKLVDGVPN